eukprot:406047_1
MAARRLREILCGASMLTINKCKGVIHFILMVIIILFAFVPILCLFTWMIPLFVLERIIPIQFFAFILNIPLIFWCHFISTIITSVTFLTCYFIDKQALVKSKSFFIYVWNEIKNNLCYEQILRTSCHFFGIAVFCLFCSFIFCVSPALYMCALFWFIYEMMKTDINIKETGLEIRQYIYKQCFSLFDDIELQYKVTNILKWHTRIDDTILSNVNHLKQIAYHIFCACLSIKHISDGQKTDGIRLKGYIECLHNNCETCSHKWEIKFIHIRDFRFFICIEICATFLIITHLFLFWFWTITYSEGQVENISLNFNSMTTYSQLLIYYIIEHLCIIIVFIAAGKIYLDDIIEYYRFDFFQLNNDPFLVKAFDEYIIPNDNFINTYCRLLYIYLDQLITYKTLKSCVKDEWLLSLLLSFSCGDKDMNVLCQKQILEMLEICILKTRSENHSDMNNEDNNENNKLILVPTNNSDHSDELQKISLDDQDFLSDFAIHFNQMVETVSSDMQCQLTNTNQVKKLIINYANYCRANEK